MIDTTPFDNFDDFFAWYISIIKSKVPDFLALSSKEIHSRIGMLTDEERDFTCKKIRKIFPIPKSIGLRNDNSQGTFYAVWDNEKKKPFVAFPSVMMYWLRYPPIVKAIIDHELGHCWGENPDILTDNKNYPDKDTTNISMDVRINQNINYEALAQVYKCVYTFDNSYFELPYIPEYWMPNKCGLPSELKTSITWQFLYKMYKAYSGDAPSKEEDDVLQVGTYVETLVDKHKFPKGNYGRVSKINTISDYVITEITQEEIDAIKNDDYEFFRNRNPFAPMGNEIGNYSYRARKSETKIPNEIKRLPIPVYQENKPKQGDIAVLIVDKPTIQKNRFGIVVNELGSNLYTIAEVTQELQDIIQKKDFGQFMQSMMTKNPFVGNKEDCIFGKEFILFPLNPPQPPQPPQPPETKKIEKPDVGDIIVITSGANKNKYGVITNIIGGTKSDGSDAQYEIQEVSEETVKIKTGRKF